MCKAALNAGIRICLGMHWGEYQPRQVAQTDNQWDVAQGEGEHRGVLMNIYINM